MAVALGLGFPVGFFQATRSHGPKESSLSAGGEDPMGGGSELWVAGVGEALHGLELSDLCCFWLTACWVSLIVYWQCSFLWPKRPQEKQSE